MSALDEFFSAWDCYNNAPETIDPALLQTSAPSSASDVHIEQEQQPLWEGQGWPAQPFGSDPEPSTHFPKMRSTAAVGSPTAEGPLHEHPVASKSPFKCHCGKTFKSLFTLKRHIKGSNKDLIPQYPCSECPAYQGKNGFKRKDNLKQHLMFFHKYDDDKLATLLPSRQTRRSAILVCHYENCEYYRGPDFKGMSIRAQDKNRPFHRQSDYTRHMKDEHDWSPYPSLRRLRSIVRRNTQDLRQQWNSLNVAPKKRSGVITVKNRSSLASLRHTNETAAEGKLHAAIATNSWNLENCGFINGSIVKGRLNVAIAMNSWNLSN
ncbi:hypothetical protein F5X98DRAFT_373920 [Xylaria grammica]|nr:hypothetical protein F5X98DRAFT_373920 [Xylaria grammica]